MQQFGTRTECGAAFATLLGKLARRLRNCKFQSFMGRIVACEDVRLGTIRSLMSMKLTVRVLMEAKMATFATSHARIVGLVIR